MKVEDSPPLHFHSIFIFSLKIQINENRIADNQREYLPFDTRVWHVILQEQHQNMASLKVANVDSLANWSPLELVQFLPVGIPFDLYYFNTRITCQRVHWIVILKLSTRFQIFFFFFKVSIILWYHTKHKIKKN